MTPEMLIIFMFVGLFIGILLGFPVALTMISVSLIIGYISLGNIAFVFPGVAINNLSYELTYIALPMFIFMGCMLEKSGVADRAFGVLEQWLRGVKGGIGIAAILICLLFAASIGVLGASVTTVGILALGPMVTRGYDKGFATGIVAAGGTLGILLPPSIVLIIFGAIAQLSLFRIFVAAVVPGLLLAVLYVLYAGIIGYVKKGIVPEVVKDINVPLQYNVRQGLASFIPFIALILIVMGALFFGIANPTEVAAFGAFGSIIVVAIYKRLTGGVVLEASLNTLSFTAMVVFIAVGASMFTTVFFINGGRRIIENTIDAMGLSGNATFALFLIVIFIMGVCMDWLGVSMVMIPIFLPILTGFGFDPIHVSIVVLVLLQTSFLTPPFAQSVLYALSVVPEGIEIKTEKAYRGALPFIAMQLFVVLLCIVFPSLTTFLPDLTLTGWGVPDIRVIRP